MTGMPIQIAGLPLHPLLVHAPIVLVPMLVVLVLFYVLIPPVRRHIGWAVFVLTFLAPGAVFAARLSGEKLAAAEVYKDMQKDITEHAGYSAVLIWLLVALAPITWLFAALERGRRSARNRRPDPVPALLDAARAADLTVTAVDVRQASLDDVFLNLTGRSLREEAQS